MSKGRDKSNIEIAPGQACVVMEKKFWDHMLNVYSIMADDCVDKAEKEDWMAISRVVKTWTEATYNDPSNLTDLA